MISGRIHARTPDTNEVPPTNSIVVPVYRNALNIEPLLITLDKLWSSLDGNLEVVFVVDGSPDNSGELLLAAQRSMCFKSVLAFHSRNFGSFVAIRSGLALAQGQAIAVMAADLQEPPELLQEFFAILARDGADIAIGNRIGRNDSFLNDILSNLYWAVYRRLVIRDVPRGGVDVFACTAAVRDELLALEEANTSLVAQLFWVGFRREFVPYVRRPREAGSSGWSFARRFRYMMDSVFSFTDFPIVLLLSVGCFSTISSVILAVAVIILRVSGVIAVPGYTTIVLLVIFFNSLTLMFQGILGAYLWRTFENTKRRPLGIVRRVLRSDGAGLPVDRVV